MADDGVMNFFGLEPTDFKSVEYLKLPVHNVQKVTPCEFKLNSINVLFYLDNPNIEVEEGKQSPYTVVEKGNGTVYAYGFPMMKKLENVDVDGTDVKVEVTPTDPILDKKGQP